MEQLGLGGASDWLELFAGQKLLVNVTTGREASADCLGEQVDAIGLLANAGLGGISYSFRYKFIFIITLYWLLGFFKGSTGLGFDLARKNERMLTQ